MAQTDDRDDINTPDTRIEMVPVTTPETSGDGDGVAEIASDFIENMPEVSQHAVDAHMAKETAQQNAPKMTDKNGTVFDPTIHTLGADGSPTLTKSGLYARKRGRKAGQSTLGSVPGAAPSGNTTRPLGEQQNVPTTGQKMSPVLMGAGAAVATANVFMAAFGPDLKPSAKNELTGQPDLDTLRDAYAQFFLESGIERVPPWIGIAIALSTYAGPKMAKPDALTRAKQLALGMANGSRNLWRKFKAWRAGGKSQQNASV